MGGHRPALDSGNWPLTAASPLPYAPGVSQVPAELDEAGLDAVREQFVAAARRAASSGFDLLELHCAHGYLLSGFLSPLTNHRTDAYGGSTAGRLRFPLEVFDAVREVWPRERPMTVRISATDWAEGGTDAEGAVTIARAFAEHGADAIDVSTGQVVPEERPEFGRSYQTPYADRIRNTVDVPVIAVGAISSWDDVNSCSWRAAPTSAPWPAPICTTRTGPSTRPPNRATRDRERPGPSRTPRAAALPPTGRTDGPKPRLTLE